MCVFLHIYNNLNLTGTYAFMYISVCDHVTSESIKQELILAILKEDSK